ncbi:MAG: hypothetical protein OXI22_14950 [Defluviicoccus sp.]|nr:hypothetical protein [Defluviicoccus sp.]MDE0385181.1 hypothetical protein [Defluviicoccus sp.]
MSAEIIALLAATLTLGWFLWTATNRINDRIERLEKRMGLVEQRVARVEGLCEGYFGKGESGGLRANGE